MCDLNPQTKRDYLIHFLQVNKFPLGKNGTQGWAARVGGTGVVGEKGVKRTFKIIFLSLYNW